MTSSDFFRQHFAALARAADVHCDHRHRYPLLIRLIAQVPGLNDRANGSLIKVSGKPVGSSLIGQMFTDSYGNPLPQYFQSRPSSAGAGYDPTVRGASNLGPEHRRHPAPIRR